MPPSDGPLGRLARWSLAHGRAVVVGALALFLIAAAVGLPPRLDANVVALLPDDQPEARALRAVAAEAGGINTIALSFEGDDRARMLDRLDRLAIELEQLDTVAFAVHRLPDDLATHVRLLRAEPTEAGVRAALADPDYALLPTGGQGRILVKPTRSNTDPDFCMRVTAEVQALLDAADLGADGVRHVYSAGPYVYIADGTEGIRTDLSRTAGITAFLVFAVLSVGFRTWRAPLVVLPPVALAAVVDLAVLDRVYGALNSFTSFGTALLIGLGVDFAVHLWARYREHRGEGLGVDDALARAWDGAGPPCVVAGLTSSAGFAALGLGQFKGLAHLGVALSVGLALCLIAMLVLLPVAIRALDPDPPPPRVGWTWRPSPTVARAVVAAVLVAALPVALWGASNLRFEHDITAMNRDRMVFSAMSDATRAMVRRAYPPVVATYPDPTTAAAAHLRLADAVAAGQLPHVRAVLSVSSFAPSDQEARLARLAALGLPELAGLAPIRVADLPDRVVQLVGGPDRVLLLVQGDLYDLRESAALIDELAGWVDAPASEQLAQGAVYRSMIDDMPRVLALAVLLIALVTAIDLRQPAWTAAVLASLALGGVFAVAALAAVGQSLTLMNLIGFPILVGIGIDVVLHLAHRLRADPDVGRALATVGGAALISTLTTLASFVSLIAASSGGIRSFGRLVVVGLAVQTVVSALALVSWVGSRR